MLNGDKLAMAAFDVLWRENYIAVAEQCLANGDTAGAFINYLRAGMSQHAKFFYR